MKKRNRPRTRFAQQMLIMMAALGLLPSFGCRSSHAPNGNDQASVAEPEKASTAGSASTPDIDLNCIIDHIQNPTEAFHYVYKKTGSAPVEEVADVTPQTIDGAFRNGDFSRPLHGVRSNSDSWHDAWTGLTGISGMASTIALVNHSSAMVQGGKDKVNGYDTFRFSIDTARGNAAEQMLYTATLGAGGFEKGDVWVTAQGCPAKMSLDSEMHSNSGVDKVHYEEAMVRK